MKHGERRRDSQGCSYYAHVELTKATWLANDQILEVYFKEYEGLCFYGFGVSSITPYMRDGESYEAFAEGFMRCFDLRIYGNILPQHPLVRIVKKARPSPVRTRQNSVSTSGASGNAMTPHRASNASIADHSSSTMKHGERRRDSQGSSYYAHVDLTGVNWYPKDEIYEVWFKEYEGLKFYGFSATSIRPYMKQGESMEAFAKRFVKDYDLRIFGNILPKHPLAKIVPKHRKALSRMTSRISSASQASAD